MVDRFAAEAEAGFGFWKCWEVSRKGARTQRGRVDCSARTIAVYSADNELRVFGDSDVIDGGIAVPGFSAKVSDFFADLDIGGPEQ